MKTKFKTLARLLMAALMLTLIGCSEEVYQTKEHSNSENKNKISLSQFKNETQINDFNTIFKVPVSANGMLNRTAELSEFVIDTIAIQRYVSENNKTTYSFRVYTMISNIQLDEKYNLVYTKENDVWEKSIIAFKERIEATSTENQLENFKKLYDSRFANTSMSSNIEACISESYFIQCDGSCSGQCDGFACPTGQCIQHVITVEQCLGSGGATPSDPNGNGPINPGPGSYDPQDPFSFTPNLYDNPVFDDPNYINAVKANSFFNHLDYGTQVWTNETPENIEIYNQIIQYQIDNNWSSPSNIFANEMIYEIIQTPNIYNSIKPLIIEKQIDDTQLDPCTKGVFQQVKNTTNSDFAQVLAKLDANGSVYNTTLISDIAPSGAIGQTIRNSAYNYTIYISTDYPGKTRLMIAQTQLHELVHAYFFSLIDDCYLQNVCELLSTYPELWEYYVNHRNGIYPSNSISHHEEIANSYVAAIASALQAFQPGLPIQVYEDLAWSGLEWTSIFDTLHPIGSTSRQRILNRKAAEQTGHPIAEGTPNEQINYGQPCN
jgi:hypothetical protein